jgi:hypothetical protein
MNETNKFPKDKILSLNDDAFRSLIFEINSLAGGNPSSAEKLASDIPSLKKQLSRMTDADAQKLLKRLGTEDKKAEDILKKLNNI